MNKIIIILLSAYLLSYPCNLQKDNLIIIDLQSSGMAFKPDGNIGVIKTSARLVFDNDIELYIEPEQHLHLEYIKDSDGVIIDEKVSSIDTTHTVYVKKKGMKNGIQYSLEKINNSYEKVFNADSLWETHSFYNKSIKNFDLDIGSPVKVIKDGNIDIEKYSMKLEIGQVDSIYRFYDKRIRHVPYSFSKKFDSISNSKLFKILGISNMISKGIALKDKAVPRREFFHEMKVVKDTRNIKIYKGIIEKFKKDSKKLNLK